MIRLLAAVAAFVPLAAFAQDYPAKPIRVIIPNAAGSVSEAIFRVMSPQIEAKLGQRFVVDSRPGADGAIGTTEVIRSAPDGYTLLLAPTANYAVTPHLFKTHNYEPLVNLEPISMIAEAPLLTIVNTQVPAKNLKELVDYVRANPGKYNYGSPGTGSPAHLTGAFFSQMAGNGVVHIPYKGTVPMITALLSSDVQMAFPTLTGVIGQMKAGKLRALAVMSKERLPEVPDVPTAVEAGYPQLVSTNWWVLSAPKSTSPRIVERLYAEFKAALGSPDVKKRVSELGHVTVGLSPADTAAFIKSESARYKTVVDKGNIRIEQ